MTRFDLLNHHTRSVLAEAAEVLPRLPPGYSVVVSAYSDVMLTEEASGQWVGLEKTCQRDRTPAWKAWRGSLWVTTDHLWPSLADAVNAFVRLRPEDGADAR